MSNHSLAGRDSRNRDFFASGNSRTHQGDNHNHNSTSNSATTLIQAQHVTVINGRYFGEVPATGEMPPEIAQSIRPPPRGLPVPRLDTSHPAMMPRGRNHTSRSSHSSARTPHSRSSIESPYSGSTSSRSSRVDSPSRIPRLSGGTLQDRRFSSLSHGSRGQGGLSFTSSISTAATTPLQEDEEFFKSPPTEQSRHTPMRSIDIAAANAHKLIDETAQKSKQTPITAIKDCGMVADKNLDKPLPRMPDKEKELPWQGHALDLATKLEGNNDLPQGTDEWPRWCIAEKHHRRKAINLEDVDEVARILDLARENLQQLRSRLQTQRSEELDLENQGW